MKPAIPSLGAMTWPIAGEPDLGALGTPNQQPVDYAIWQAKDGTWQLWSCIRNTLEPGNSRLFFRWEGASITDHDWAPKGIAMHADPTFGEVQGGLQAPYVLRDPDGTFRMIYGTWGNLGVQTSTDGKTFQRVVRADGTVHLFAATDSKRDPMLLPIAGVDHLYFTDNPGGQGGVYLSTSTDGATFTDPMLVAYGGASGKGGSAAECPFVIYHDGFYYLFRTSSEMAASNYAPGTMTRVYASTSPDDFGVNDDSHLVATFPIAAVEIHQVGGVDYLAHLRADVKGIEMTTLDWSAQ